MIEYIHHVIELSRTPKIKIVDWTKKKNSILFIQTLISTIVLLALFYVFIALFYVFLALLYIFLALFYAFFALFYFIWLSWDVHQSINQHFIQISMIHWQYWFFLFVQWIIPPCSDVSLHFDRMLHHLVPAKHTVNVRH